ncbi:MAG: hypothetical protein MUE81_05990, partial [Thermoflexibacter sp.]|nr:hypothetical protein [Thermoflexibacter sp.]
MNVVAQIEIVKERFKDRVRELASLQVIGIYLFALFILLVVLFASKLFEIPMPNFTGDMPRLGKLKFYSGIMTNLGVFLWSLSGTVCIFALWVLRRYLTTQKVNYLLFSGIISYFFAIDDFFMFHETLELHSGISEKFIFLAYMIV